MKRLSQFFVLFITLSITVIGQTQTPPSKQKQLADGEKRIDEGRKLLTDIEARLKELLLLKAQQEALIKELEEQQQLIEKLKDDIQAEEEEKAFQESPARTILDVTGLDTYLIDFNGKPRWVRLHGLKVKNYEIPFATIKTYKKKLVKKKVFVRCADADCDKVYLYELKTNPSLNALLIANNVASATDEALFDVVSYVPRSTPTYSSNSTAGTDVSVRGYYRKDGTYVRPHTRSAPGRKR